MLVSPPSPENRKWGDDEISKESARRGGRSGRGYRDGAGGSSIAGQCLDSGGRRPRELRMDQRLPRPAGGASPPPGSPAAAPGGGQYPRQHQPGRERRG